MKSRRRIRNIEGERGSKSPRGCNSPTQDPTGEKETDEGSPSIILARTDGHSLRKKKPAIREGSQIMGDAKKKHLRTESLREKKKEGVSKKTRTQ